MTEADLLAEVTAMAAERGILALHVPDKLVRSMRPNWAGFPDLLLIGCDVLWAELKADGRAGQLRPSQRIFAYRLAAAGQAFAAWSPADLRAGRITGALDRLSAH